MLTLQAGEGSLTLAPEIGGSIVGWTIGPNHVLRPPLVDALVQGSARGMAAYPLVPYSNRIDHGRFSFAGRSYQLARNFGDDRLPPLDEVGKPALDHPPGILPLP